MDEMENEVITEDESVNEETSYEAIMQEQEEKEYFYRIDFVKLLDVFDRHMGAASSRRKPFLDGCSNPSLYIKMISGEYPISGSFINELDSFLSNRGDEGILVKTEELDERHIYLNKETLNFMQKNIEEERHKIFPVEYKVLGNPELHRLMLLKILDIKKSMENT